MEATREPATLRGAAFSLLAVIGVAVIQHTTSQYSYLPTVAVLAVSTAAGMHARLAMGRWPAAAQIAAGAALLWIIGAPPVLAGEVLLAGLAGAEWIAPCTRRSSVMRVGVWTGIVAGAASVPGLLAAVNPTMSHSLREALAAAAGGLLGAPLMLAAGPAAEWLFGHTTRLTMSEWLSYDHPLLRDLASIAPGTFQHSINVSVLADAAARAIGRDTLLARLGSLYHDVGKMRAPEYFVENQRDVNPHDGLDPRESARILRAHVFDGLELVAAHRMGERIADVVREHHGTGPMRLFLAKAAALGLSDGTDDEAYRYTGPRPRSPETGIVMIADQLEATARSAPPEDEAACVAMIQQTLDRIMDDRELEDSGLTPADLGRIRLALVEALIAMHHRRMTYPPSRPARPAGGFLPKLIARARRGA